MSTHRISYIRNKVSPLIPLFVKPRIVVNGDDNNGYFVSIYSRRLKPSLQTYVSSVSATFPGAIPFVDLSMNDGNGELEFWFAVPYNIYTHVK